jgi:hypothetical protein
MVSIVGARRSAQEPICKSPKAEAARTTKIDQLGGKVGHENSPRNPQPVPLRAGDGVRCDACGTALDLITAGEQP